MGHHYIPQYYLRGFCQNFGRTIWVYDKLESCRFSTQVKSIANICGFYSPELEKYLSEEIENPANQVLDKIRNREIPTPYDKITLSRYIAVMWKRVPSGRKSFKSQAPKVASKLRDKFHRQLDEIVAINPSKEDLARQRKAEIDEILNAYSNDPPEDVWHQLVRAEQTPRMIAAIATMSWKFLTFDKNPVFLTCDNPVFIFRSLGVGRPESELSFPLSMHIILWATRRLDRTKDYIPATPAIVKEMNRRTASVATRYVFHAKDEGWILPFLSKKSWRLNRIQ